MNLSPSQSQALTDILDWHKTNNKLPYLTLGGYAGTGKTTLIANFRKHLVKQNAALKVNFCSYTGKATRVLESKLKALSAVHAGDTIGTIHSLIYSPVVDKKENIVGWEKRDEINADLIVIDEGSMVDANIWNDIRSYGVPILVAGDHGQLAPINGKFNLMANPMVKLTEIHRQVAENPIIKISILAREEGKIPCEKFNDHVMKISRSGEMSNEQVQEELNRYSPDTLILCGYNHTRVKINNHIRQNLGFYEPEPQAGDRVICLRNNHQEKIFNGMLGTVQSASHNIEEGWHFANIQMDDESHDFKGLINAKQFNSLGAMNFTENRKDTLMGDLFDFGYALTVHKAQGSEARKVILFEERFAKMDDDSWRRWLYTAVTRAREELFIVGS